MQVYGISAATALMVRSIRNGTLPEHDKSKFVSVERVNLMMMQDNEEVVLERALQTSGLLKVRRNALFLLYMHAMWNAAYDVVHSRDVLVLVLWRSAGLTALCQMAVYACFRWNTTSFARISLGSCRASGFRASCRRLTILLKRYAARMPRQCITISIGLCYLEACVAASLSLI